MKYIDKESNVRSGRIVLKNQKTECEIEEDVEEKDEEKGNE